MQEMQVRSLGREDPLEKGMATHSSILAWRSPWTEEPGGLWATLHGGSKNQILLSDWTTTVTSDPTHHAATSTCHKTDAAWMYRTFPVGSNHYPRLCCGAAQPGFGLVSDWGEERKGKSLSHSVTPDSVTPWTVAHQALRSMGFSRHEHWSG